MEYRPRRNFLIGEKEPELARIVDCLRHLRVKADETIRDWWLTLLGLGGEEGQATYAQRCPDHQLICLLISQLT